MTPDALLTVGERPLTLPPWEGGWVEFRNGGFLGEIVGRNDWSGCYTYSDGVLEFGETFQTLASCQCVLDEVEVAVTEAGRFEVKFAGADRMVWSSDNVGLRLTREP